MSYHRFTDLVLLVGTNPLPNYVVAKYFLMFEKDLQRIWFISSSTNKEINQKGTDNIAMTLKKQLKVGLKDKAKVVEMLDVHLSDISSAEKIERDINNGIARQYNKGKWNLNYTGGTKSMAVHVYRQSSELLGDNISFSYLDSRTHRILFDKSVLEPTVDLRSRVLVEINQLLELHNFRRKVNWNVCGNDEVELNSH